jgi:hypothetical protein
MPTTTNYGWTTPADTDLVKDGASAIRTLGTSVDTTVKNLNPETTLGDLAYRSSTANVKTRLGLGTAGQVLAVNSGATAPEWKTISSGAVVQVVSATYGSATASSSTTYADTGLTASITPTSASNKVLVIVSQNGCSKTAGNSGNSLGLRLVRGSTTIAQIAVETGYTGSSGFLMMGSAGIAYLDSPATTSSTTYKTTFNNAVNASQVNVQGDGSVSSITLIEVTP